MFSVLQRGFLVSLALTFSVTATALTMPKTLKETMKAMSARLKTINGQVNIVAKNADSQLLAEELVLLTRHAKGFVPKSVESLSPADRGPAIDKYTQMIEQTADLGAQLAVAFKVNDNAKAASLIAPLNQAKKDGHDEFK
jgi:hypothetical protein